MRAKGLQSLRITVLAALAASSSLLHAQGLEFMGIGPRLSFVIAEDVGAAIGGGGHFIMEFGLGRAGTWAICPNIEMWFGHEELGPGQWPYYGYPQYDLYAFELSFNADGRYYFPLPPSVPVAPYVGMGFGVVTTAREFDPGADYTDVNPGFNMLGGLDIPVGNHKLFGEFKGKFGDEFNAFKMTAGFTFTIR